MSKPYAVTSDKVRLYFEEAGAGHPSSSCMNRADHTNWEPQRGPVISRAGTAASPIQRALHAIRCASVIRCLHLQTFLHRRTGRARPPEIDKRISSACRWDPILAADRLNAPWARIVADLAAVGSGSDLTISTRSASMPGQWRAI